MVAVHGGHGHAAPQYGRPRCPLPRRVTGETRPVRTCLGPPHSDVCAPRRRDGRCSLVSFPVAAAKPEVIVAGMAGSVKSPSRAVAVDVSVAGHRRSHQDPVSTIGTETWYASFTINLHGTVSAGGRPLAFVDAGRQYPTCSTPTRRRGYGSRSRHALLTRPDTVPPGSCGSRSVSCTEGCDIRPGRRIARRGGSGHGRSRRSGIRAEGTRHPLQCWTSTRRSRARAKRAAKEFPGIGRRVTEADDC